MPYDLLQYVCPPNGRQYRLFGIGDENCQCVQAEDGWLEFRKNRHMEEFYVTDSVIGRGADTSDISADGVNPTGQFYVLYTRRADGKPIYGAPWAKRQMSVNEKYHRDCHVIRYSVDGSILAEYDDASDLVVNAYHLALNFPQSGITIPDVLELQWGGEEVYYYAREYGLVGWKNLRTGQGTYVGEQSASIKEPFPHNVAPRPRVSKPSHALVEPISPYPDGTNPQQMQVSLTDGIWLLGAPGTGSLHIRVLPYREIVTVFSEPIVPAGRFDWRRVATCCGEQGWSAAVVDGVASFRLLDEAIPEMAEVADSAPPAYPPAENPQQMKVNLAGGIWLLGCPGIRSEHLRVLEYREIVTVYDRPVISADEYRWKRVTTCRNEQGWSAISVGGRPSFTKMETRSQTDFRLIYPVAVPPEVGQPFGVNWTGIPDFYTRWGLPAHEGIDFGGRLGDPIDAAAAGSVLAIQIPGEGGVRTDHAYGIHIKIKHVFAGQVYETDYCHLSSVAPGLAVGHPVAAGQPIGEMGNTGNVVAGAIHLHFILRKQGATAARELQRLGDGSEATYKNDIVDPTPYLP